MQVIRKARCVGTMALLLSVAVSCQAGIAADQSIIVQSTTSTANSGLYDHLLPKFKAATGITVHVVAVGTGQAIRNARQCDGDVLLVHAKAAEEAFVADGFGVSRQDLMYNDFVIIGPPSDPADLASASTAAQALERVAEKQALFASRGDDSGTHKKEQALWQSAGFDPSQASGKWYRETGSGMGATLNVGVGMGAYVMTDRATWIAFKNKAGFKITVQGDEQLFNQYGVIAVNPVKCPNVKAAAAETFVNWLISEQGQQAIGSYRKLGEQLFTPNAGAAESR
ncbi:MAG: substrate-binding domain-containing protein [Burkholderiaceae bacterium]